MRPIRRVRYDGLSYRFIGYGRDVMTAKCVVVTGASGAIGSAICRLFGQAGWKVMPLSIRLGKPVALRREPIDALICAHAASVSAPSDVVFNSDVILTREICHVA